MVGAHAESLVRWANLDVLGGDLEDSAFLLVAHRQIDGAGPMEGKKQLLRLVHCRAFFHNAAEGQDKGHALEIKLRRAVAGRGDFIRHQT